MRIAFFIDGTFIPERDGASTRFARLPSAISRSGLSVRVFHAFRGWSCLERIAKEPYLTYFFNPNNYYNNQNLLARLINHESINIIQMNDLETIQKIGIPLAHATGVKLVYEAHYHSSTLARQLGLPKAKIKTIESLERKIADNVDHIITFSDPDRQRWVGLSRVFPDRVSIVPFGFDCANSRTDFGLAGWPSVVFIGNGYFEPNRRAVMRIVSEIWPSLRSRITDSSCLIIGDMPAKLRTACLKVGIKVAGEVPDPSELIRSCAIGIAPVSEGSGVRVKLLQYLSAGLPVVATSAAAEGLTFPAIVIEDRLSFYANVIQDLLADSQRVERLVQESQYLLMQKYTWKDIAETAKETYRRVTNRQTRKRCDPGPRFDDLPMWLDEALRSGRFAGYDDRADIAYTYGVAHDGTISLY